MWFWSYSIWKLKLKVSLEFHPSAKMIFAEFAEWPKKEDGYTILFDNIYKS